MKPVLFIFMLLSSYLYSQDLVYKPINPAFGGDTFNYNWLLSSAEAQNTLTEDSSSGRETLSDLDRFTQNLNNQLLSQLSRSLFVQQIGDQGLEVGTYTFGTLLVDIFPSNEGLVINILDTNTGEQTQIIVPTL